jgi:hypothetical protein
MSLFRGVNDTQQALAGLSAETMKQTLGLENVNNTSDTNKPISLAVQSALDAKQDTLSSGVNIKTINGESIVGGGNIVVSGGSGGGGSGATNLSVGAVTTTTLNVISDTGTAATIPAGTTTAAGLKTAADSVKLGNIATGATANSTDAQLRDRTSHTGVQSISTVSGLQTALDTKQASLVGLFIPAADTSAAINTACAAAKAAGGGTVWLGNRTYTCTSTITCDPSSVSIQGESATLNFSTAGNIVALLLDSSNSADVKHGHAQSFSGFILRGNASGNSSHIAIHLHTPTNGEATTNIENVVIEYFGIGILVGSNAYIQTFRGVSIGWCTLCVSRQSFVNNGENMTFFGCMFFNSGKCLDLRGPNQEWRFYGCSFDYCAQIVYSDAPMVEFHGCHFESAASNFSSLGNWQSSFEGDNNATFRFYGGEIALTNSQLSQDVVFKSWGTGGAFYEFYGCEMPTSLHYAVALSNDLSRIRQVLVNNKSVKTVNGESLFGTGNIAITLPTYTSTFNTKIGYTTGASQGTITWGSTYTLNALSGQIDFGSTVFTANEVKSFIVNNSNVLSSDIVTLTESIDFTLSGFNDFVFKCAVNKNSTNSFKVFARCLNPSGATLPAGTLNFAVIKAFYDIWITLSTFGTNAHLYIPGVGTITGKVAGNFSDSGATTPATVGGMVGYIDDIYGTLNVAQSTDAKKPLLKSDGVNYYLEFNGTTNSRKLGIGSGLVDGDACFFVFGYSSNIDSNQMLATVMDGSTGYTLMTINCANNVISVICSNPNRSFTISGTGVATNTKAVVAVRFSGTTVTLWYNGVQIGSNALGAVSTGMSTTYYVGTNAFDNTPFSGNLYAHCWGKGTVSDSDLVKIMRSVNELTGATTF